MYNKETAISLTGHRKNSTQLLPVPPALRKRLWLGVAGSGIFMIAALIEGMQRPGFDPWQQSVSSLSLGPGGWLQITSFILFGLLVIYTCPAWQRLLHGNKGAKTYTVLIFCTGCSLILCGLFKQDPAPGYDPQQLLLADPTLHGLLHLLFASVGALCPIAGLVIASRYFDKKPLWHGWKMYTLLMALVMTACVVTYAVWSTKPTGYAGLFERIGLLVVPVWTLTFTIRLDAGIPFMIQAGETPL